MLIERPTHSILTENLSQDVPYRWTVNAYRGCEMGCIYCWGRGTHEYSRLDPASNFDRVIWVKMNAAERLNEAGVEPGVTVAPVIDALNDDQIAEVVETAARSAALHAEFVRLCGLHGFRVAAFEKRAEPADDLSPGARGQLPLLEAPRCGRLETRAGDAGIDFVIQAQRRAHAGYRIVKSLIDETGRR